MGYYHRWVYSGMGKYTFKFHLLWRRRLLPDRTKQYFCHHPHAGICANGHLFPVYIRCPALHPVYAGDFASIAFLISLFFLFKGYQHPRPAGTMFYSFLFIGLGSLFFPQLTLFIPLYWIGAYGFQALTPKSFFGSLIGWT